MNRTILILATLTVATPAWSRPARTGAVESISYEAGPCFGACPIFRVTVRSDGTATFEGVNFTAVRGVRRFRVTPGQYRAFANHLAPVRPARGSIEYNGERCRSMATDMPSATVTWTGRRGRQRFHLYYGCDMERNRALAERLSRAPRLLPIGDFIGPRR